MTKKTIKSLVIILLFPSLLASRDNSLEHAAGNRISNFQFSTFNLERALRLAAGNRGELEKTLEHYAKNPADSLKLKAALFLIRDMDACSFPVSSQTVPDIQYVTAGFLIDNIDRAFEAWKKPYAGELGFDDFCEYLLPYKSGEKERPDFWRSVYNESFYPYVKQGLEITCRLDSSLISHRPSVILTGKDYFFIPEDFDTIPEFTVSCMVNPSEHRRWTRVFDFGKDPANYVCFVPYNQDGVALFQLVSSPNVWEDIKLNAPLPLNRFTHVAMTYSRNFISFYVDGMLKKRIKTSLTHRDMLRNCVGRAGKSGKLTSGSGSASGSGRYFKGEIADFRIYSRELNYAEIHALAGKTGLPSLEQRLLAVVQGVSRQYDINIVYKPLAGGYTAAELINMKEGSCGDYAVLGNAIFRSIGIPVAVDFVPQWANRSMGHSWNALYTGGGKTADYSFGSIALLDTVGCHLKESEEKEMNKAAKIFRKTYSRQAQTPAVRQKDKYLPALFRDPCIKDVTEAYLDCMDLSVSLTQQPARKREYAYLCNFNNRDWIPVHWGEIKEGKVLFTKMGKGIAYLPAYYHWGGIQPAAEPFILTQKGETQKLVPDFSKKQTLVLTRKYRPGNIHQKGELLLGGRFQVANRPDFSDSVTVFTVNEVPEIRYNPVPVSLDKPYRYFRYLAPAGSVGDISEIEVYSPQSKVKLSGKVTGNQNCPEDRGAANAFDGDPLTAYQCAWGERGCVGLDFGKPLPISSFRFLPRNDDNFIKEGEEYELFYWDKHQWNSLGRQTGTETQLLEYKNAPFNALFLLRNLTKGREERIFTYENGQQVWW